MTLCVLYSFVEAADTVLYSCVQLCTVHTAQLSCESARGRVQSCRAQRTRSRPAELDTRQQEPGRFEQSRTSLSQCQHQCHLQHWQLRTAQPWHQKLVFSEVKWASSDEWANRSWRSPTKASEVVASLSSFVWRLCMCCIVGFQHQHPKWFIFELHTFFPKYDRIFVWNFFQYINSFWLQS